MPSTQKSSILVVRLSAIGDIVMSSPVARAIKERWPNSELTWIVQPECAALLRSNSYVDNLIVWDKNHWKSLLKRGKFATFWQEIRKFRSMLRAYHFELAIDLQGLMKSAILVWLSGAKHRVGLGCQEGSNMLMTKTISRNLGDLDQIGSEYRYLVNQLGMTDSPWDMSISFTNEILEKINNLLAIHVDDARFAVFCPFTTRAQKHWFEKHWIQLAKTLIDLYGLKIVILGGPGDTDNAKIMAERCDAISLAGQTSLQEAAAIISKASLLVGVDTGLTHMGHGYNIPTVALFGSTCPYTYTGLDSSKIIYLDLPCSPCRRNPTCGGTYDCMRKISPETVLTEIKSIFK